MDGMDDHGDKQFEGFLTSMDKTNTNLMKMGRLMALSTILGAVLHAVILRSGMTRLKK